MLFFISRSEWRNGCEIVKYQSWAKWFYNSKAWKVCRAAYISKVFGLCERCPKPGKILHHTVYLTPENIRDPNISLNHDLLEFVCLECHNKIHFGSVEPLVNEGLAFDAEGNLIEVGDGYDL